MSNKKNEMFDDISGVSIVSTGKKVQQEKTVQEQAEDFVAGGGHPPADEKFENMNDIFDRFSHAKYVVDMSGSMGEGMRSEASTDQYLWDEESLNSLRAVLVLQEQEEADEDEEFDEEEDEDFPEDEEEEVSFADYSDEELKRHAVRTGSATYRGTLICEGVEFKANPSYKRPRGFVNETKMMTFKKVAKKFVEERFKKYPDAKVGVAAFDDSPVQLAQAGATEAAVIAAIESLPDNGAGGTNIYRAVSAALADIKKKPSEVNAHHIILVSDGCDSGATEIEKLVPKMKELGVVFDFIFVQGLSGDVEGERVAKVLRRVCEMTGGEYIEVRTREDFEEKLLQVSNRPMLPPSRS